MNCNKLVNFEKKRSVARRIFLFLRRKWRLLLELRTQCKLEGKFGNLKERKYIWIFQ